MSDSVNDDECCDFQPLFSSTNNRIYKMHHGKTITLSTRRRDTVILSSEDNPKLFIDNIWPGSLVMSDYLQDMPTICSAKTVVELGAGTALPALVASHLGASNTIVTDYPDQSVIDNLSNLVTSNDAKNTLVLPFRWGDDTRDLISNNGGLKFQLVLIAEPLWKDTYPLHDMLLKSINELLSEDGQAIITFAHRPTVNHRPENDLELFSKGLSTYNLQSIYIGSSSKYRDAQEDEDYIEVHIYTMRHKIQDGVCN